MGALDGIESSKNANPRGPGRKSFPLRGRRTCGAIETGLSVILIELQKTIPALQSYRISDVRKGAALLIAEPGAGAQDTHQDTDSNDDGVEAQYLSCLIALQPTNETNGLTTLFHIHGDGSTTPPPETAKVSVELETWGALVFAAETWHYGGANHSSETRRMVHFYLEHELAYALEIYA